MNPVEGRAPIGRKKPATPWGYPALERRSRKRNKRKLILTPRWLKKESKKSRKYYSIWPIHPNIRKWNNRKSRVTNQTVKSKGYKSKFM